MKQIITSSEIFWGDDDETFGFAHTLYNISVHFQLNYYYYWRHLTPTKYQIPKLHPDSLALLAGEFWRVLLSFVIWNKVKNCLKYRWNVITSNDDDIKMFCIFFRILCWLLSHTANRSLDALHSTACRSKVFGRQLLKSTQNYCEFHQGDSNRVREAEKMFDI